MNFNLVIVKNIALVSMALILNACTSVNANLLPGQISDMSTNLGLNGKKAAVTSHSINRCGEIKYGFGSFISYVQPVERKISSLLVSKGYKMVATDKLMADDLLVDISYRCHSPYFNAWLYGFTVGILPAWGGEYITATIDLKSGGGSLLARHRVTGETTNYMSFMSPIGLIPGTSGPNSVNSLSEGIASAFSKLPSKM